MCEPRGSSKRSLLDYDVILLLLLHIFNTIFALGKGLFQLHYGWMLQHKNVKNAGLTRTVQTETMYVGH